MTADSRDGPLARAPIGVQQTGQLPGLAGAAGADFERGMRLDALREGGRVLVETVNRLYRLERRAGQIWISGHPRFCPEPVPVKVRGSSWGGSMLKVAYLGQGLHMEFEHPQFSTIVTSRIVAIGPA